MTVSVLRRGLGAPPVAAAAVRRIEGGGMAQVLVVVLATAVGCRGARVVIVL